MFLKLKKTLLTAASVLMLAVISVTPAYSAKL